MTKIHLNDPVSFSKRLTRTGGTLHHVWVICLALLYYFDSTLMGDMKRVFIKNSQMDRSLKSAFISK